MSRATLPLKPAGCGRWWGWGSSLRPQLLVPHQHPYSPLACSHSILSLCLCPQVVSSFCVSSSPGRLFSQWLHWPSSQWLCTHGDHGPWVRVSAFTHVLSEQDSLYFNRTCDPHPGLGIQPGLGAGGLDGSRKGQSPSCHTARGDFPGPSGATCQLLGQLRSKSAVLGGRCPLQFRFKRTRPRVTEQRNKKTSSVPMDTKPQNLSQGVGGT